MGRQLDPVRATERWFMHHGVPQFVEGYNSSRDIWTRAQPILLAILALELVPLFLVTLIPGESFRWVPAVIAVLMLVGFGLWSKRTRGTWFAPADRVGWPFLIFFVVAPTLLAVILARSMPEFSTGFVGDTASGFLGQLIILAIVYLVTRYALIAMLGFGVRQTFRHFGDFFTVATKALPLLLIVTIVLFINAEMWQVAGGLEAGLLWSSVGMLLILGVLTTLARTREQVSALQPNTTVEQMVEACEVTPLAGLLPANPPQAPPLSRRQRGNLIAASLMRQFIQAFVIGTTVWAFFMIFGIVAVTLPVQEGWMGALGTPEVLYTFGIDHVVTRALFRVSTFMGAFAAFYVTIYAATDDVYRRSFAEDVTEDMQRMVDVRRGYLAARDAAVPV